MNHLADVAQRLRAVREARERFLALHAVDVAIVQPGLDRIAEDVFDGGGHGSDAADDDEPETPDWRSLAADAADDDGPISPGW